MLPFFEQAPLWTTIWSPQTALDGVVIPPGGDWVNYGQYPPFMVKLGTVLCPSDGKAAAPTHANNGNISNVSYAFSRGDGISNIVSTSKPRGAFMWGRCRMLSDLTDGTSNTIYVSEMAVYSGNRADLMGSYCMNVSGLNTSPIIAMSFKGPAGTLVNCTPADSHQRRGESWASGYPLCTGFNTVIPPNGPMASRTKGEWEWGVFPPQSFHPGGVNGGMGDGSVRFISETINTGNLALPEANNSAAQPPYNKMSPYGVWGALGSASGGEPTSGNF
jgi:hypothetical protein